MKYIAIKVDGFDYWLWFDVAKVKEDSIRFIGKDGWGAHGARTDIDVSVSLIRGRIESESPQYR